MVHGKVSPDNVSVSLSGGDPENGKRGSFAPRTVQSPLRRSSSPINSREPGKVLAEDIAVRCLHREKQRREGRFGLPGMEERAHAIRGKLVVWSELEAGH